MNAKEEENKDGEKTGNWLDPEQAKDPKQCEIIDDTEHGLEFVKREDDGLREYKEAWKEAHRKCSFHFGNYNPADNLAPYDHRKVLLAIHTNVP